MTPESTISELKRIRSLTHSSPILAIENALDRLIRSLEESDQEVEKLWRGESLTSLDVNLSYRLERN